MFTNYTETELELLIANQEEENLHLEYKSADALYETDGKKKADRAKDISKDVSSFANSDGGTIIYGIKEDGHLPTKIVPVDRKKMSKETLEQIINNNIKPKIPNIKITPISIGENSNNAVYVVEINQSSTAHQANNHIYYKRHNSTTTEMDAYEVQDVMNRQITPNLDVICNPGLLKYNNNILSFSILIRNNSIKIAEKIKVMVELFNTQDFDIQNINSFQKHSDINNGREIYSNIGQAEIYKGADSRIGEFKLQLKKDICGISYKIQVLGNNMEPLIHEIIIKIDQGIPKYDIVM